MNADWLYVQDTFSSSGSLATGLLNNVRHRVALVLESQLCVWGGGGGGGGKGVEEREKM